MKQTNLERSVLENLGNHHKPANSREKKKKTKTKNIKEKQNIFLYTVAIVKIYIHTYDKMIQRMVFQTLINNVIVTRSTCFNV